MQRGGLALNGSAAGDIYMFSTAASGENKYLYIYGYVNGVGAKKYVRERINSSGIFSWQRQDTNISRMEVQFPFLSTAPAAEIIAAAGTITSDACGSQKMICVSTCAGTEGAIVTDTTNTITAPASANDGCVMQLVNGDDNDNITLDGNAKFNNSVDIILTPKDGVTVSSDGSTMWYVTGTNLTP